MHDDFPSTSVARSHTRIPASHGLMRKKEVQHTRNSIRLYMSSACRILTSCVHSTTAMPIPQMGFALIAHRIRTEIRRSNETARRAKIHGLGNQTVQSDYASRALSDSHAMWFLANHYLYSRLNVHGATNLW